LRTAVCPGLKVRFVVESKYLVDLSLVDFDRPVATLDDIRRVNPQRFEMEQLTAVVYVNEQDYACVGYKDVTDHEFWARGHMPGFPLMPGVVLCEAAAQLCSYYVMTQKCFDSDFVGLGGLSDVKFRGMVRPGERLVLIGRMTRERKMIAECSVQGFVGPKMMFEAKVQGIPLNRG
jgi:3-hydroxyacyl-[acyl-carrier-protein] dehydratase